jgi:phenylpyruvate tautomerase PptA (4-oxalocrotonate tautomerase family)
MPIVRIDAPAALQPERLRAVADAVHAALVTHMNVPEADRFQIISRHDAAHLLIDPHYPSVERTGEALIVAVTLRAGRTDARKQAFYRTVGAGAHEHAGIKPDDVMIALNENAPIDWSFGRGEALYALTTKAGS